MSSNAAITLSGLARRLVKDGVLTEQVAQEAFQGAARDKRPFVSYLVEHKLADGPKRHPMSSAHHYLI
jgi:type IV pilus assembly protein PilB